METILYEYKMRSLFLQYNGSLKEFVSSIYYTSMGCIDKYVVKFGSSHNWSDLGDMVFILFVCDIYTNQLHFIKG
jgi:hypothetical protein